MRFCYTIGMDNLEKKIQSFMPYLNESQTRKYLASEAIALGRGGIAQISEISGVHRNTISAGVKELRNPQKIEEESAKVNNSTRIRAPGGGRKPITVSQPGILDALDRIVDPESYGDPMRPLRWTTKTLRNLSDALKAEGFQIEKDKVGDLLKYLGFSLQQNQKMKQVGKESPDRDAQFRHINDTVLIYLESGDPVISIDCKKKENIGNFKNNGAEYLPKGNPTKVLDHDFPLPENGKAAPYGVYDIANNEGYVNVGISSDTAMFAVNSVRSWWQYMGAERFPNAKRLFITADGGGSNGSRCRLWKKELQSLVNQLEIPIEVSHFPPGTSKWNKVEHRLFSQITRNWKEKPLTSLEVIVSLIAATSTSTGLTVKCGVDTNTYETGIKIDDDEYDNINIIRNAFCGNWNYTILPQ